MAANSSEASVSSQPGVAAEANKLERLSQGSLDHFSGANDALHAELNQLSRENPSFIKSVNAQLQNDKTANPNLPDIEITYDKGMSSVGGLLPGIGKHVEINATEGSGKSETAIEGSSDHKIDLGGLLPTLHEGGISDIQPGKPLKFPLSGGPLEH